ncbi:MAG: transposase [Pseudomonadota bacterium]
MPSSTDRFPMCYEPEFVAEPLQDWLRRVGLEPIRILPGSPWENGYNERFNGTLRRELLDAEWFSTTRQALVVTDVWLRQNNRIRPHEALGMRPPVPETCCVPGKLGHPLLEFSAA